MERFSALNFPYYRFRVTEVAGSKRIWDPVRKRWFVMTPEEWVRVHVLRYLTEGLSIPGVMIRCEYPVSMNNQPQRADVVVCSRDGQPRMVIECKAPTVALDDAVLSQAVRYNSILQAPYLWITNGLTHRCYQLSATGGYLAMDRLPSTSALHLFTSPATHTDQ